MCRQQSAEGALPLSAVWGHGSPKPHSEDCLARLFPCMNEPINPRPGLALPLLVLWNCLLPVLRNAGTHVSVLSESLEPCFPSSAFDPSALCHVKRASVLGGGRELLLL